MNDTQLINIIFGEYASKSIKRFTKEGMKKVDYLVSKGYAEYFHSGTHIQFLKYPPKKKKSIGIND